MAAVMMIDSLSAVCGGGQKTGIEVMKTYMCLVCGVAYDEATGWSEEGLAPGTLWADVPADWRCPECGVGKADFVMCDI